MALFFSAFLPQFVDPGASIPIWIQFLVLGTLVNLTFSSADIVTVVFASEVTRRLKPVLRTSSEIAHNSARFEPICRPKP